MFMLNAVKNHEKKRKEDESLDKSLGIVYSHVVLAMHDSLISTGMMQISYDRINNAWTEIDI